MRDLSRLTARLTALGYKPILEKLLDGPLQENIELCFGNLSTAKSVQAALYSWLYFYPWVKSRVKLRLNKDIGILHIIPTGRTETRGRGLREK